jgi:hypothetical protein
VADVGSRLAIVAGALAVFLIAFIVILKKG